MYLSTLLINNIINGEELIFSNWQKYSRENDKKMFHFLSMYKSVYIKRTLNVGKIYMKEYLF